MPPLTEQIIVRTIARRLKVIRCEAGLTQAQLAEAMNVSTLQIYKYEHGLNRITADKLYLAATRMQVPVASFYDDPALNNIKNHAGMSA